MRNNKIAPDATPFGTGNRGSMTGSGMKIGVKRFSQQSLHSVPSFFSVDGLRLASFSNDRASMASMPEDNGIGASMSEEEHPWDPSSNAPMHIIEVKNGKNNERKVF